LPPMLMGRNSVAGVDLFDAEATGPRAPGSSVPFAAVPKPKIVQVCDSQVSANIGSKPRNPVTVGRLPGSSPCIRREKSPVHWAFRARAISCGKYRGEVPTSRRHQDSCRKGDTGTQNFRRDELRRTDARAAERKPRRPKSAPGCVFQASVVNVGAKLQVGTLMPLCPGYRCAGRVRR
jgi:hypothetical protein